MQHVLRCWERQSDGSEYKKTLRRSLQRSHKPPSWWGGAGCPLPKNPIPTPSPALGPFGPRLSYPHSKTSSDAVAWGYYCYLWTNRQCDSGLRLASQTHSITVLWPIPNYTAWWVGTCQRTIKLRTTFMISPT